MSRLTGSAITAAILWIASICWLLAGHATSHRDVYLLLLSLSIGSTAVAAIDRHRGQLAEISALSYRAGTAASRREMRLLGGEMPAEPSGQVV